MPIAAPEWEDPPRPVSVGVLRVAAILVVLTIVVLVPLYGIAYPPLADLPLQIVVNKLLWEKLTGASHLDLEISWYLGYRLISFVIVPIIGLLRIAGVSLLSLPSVVCLAIIGLHTAIVGGAALWQSPDSRWRTLALYASLLTPALVAVYSACWFIGFVSYTLGIALLVPSIFLTERFISTGDHRIAAVLTVNLVLVYAAHPFAIFFWLAWCMSRCMTALFSGSLRHEIKQTLRLGLIFLPLVLYHALGSFWNGASIVKMPFLENSPVVGASEWYTSRFSQLITGGYLQADDNAGYAIFGIGIIVMIFGAAIVALVFGRSEGSHRWMMTTLIFVFATSWVNELALPTPAGHWLGFEFRWVSTVSVIALSVSAMVLIRFLHTVERSEKGGVAIAFAAFCLSISLVHIAQVRAAYRRFDEVAKPYMAQILKHKRADENILRLSRFFTPKSLSHYVCLIQSDCDRTGTFFRTIGGDVYPIRVRSPIRTLPENGVPVDDSIERVSAFWGSEGYGPGQFSLPRGIAADKDGNFYVADTDNDRIQKFDAEGSFITAFGTPGTGVGEFRGPISIAVDSKGHVYVGDTMNHRLCRFDSDGRLDMAWSQKAPTPLGPLDMAAGNDDRLYILDAEHNRIVIYDPGPGTFTSWGHWGKGLGELNGSSGIAVTKENVFIVDNTGMRVQVFTLAGGFVRSWPVPELQNYPYHNPHIAVDEQAHRVYVSCGLSGEVLEYDLEGKKLNSYKPDGLQALYTPSAMAITRSADGARLLIVDSAVNDPRIASASLSGERSGAWHKAEDH